MSDVPILCFHPPTPPSAVKQPLCTPPTPPATPPPTRPPPPSLEPDAPCDALDQMEVDDDSDSDSALDSPPLILSPLEDDSHGNISGLRLSVSETEAPGDSYSTSDFPTSWSTPTTPSLSTARESWLSAQSRRASASARGEFKIPKHEQDWSAAETYVATLEESLMALYRCLEEMEIGSAEEVEER